MKFEDKRNKLEKPNKKVLTRGVRSDIMGTLSRKSEREKHSRCGQAQKSEKNTKKYLTNGSGCAILLKSPRKGGGGDGP